jgi:hypothetical protein
LPQVFHDSFVSPGTKIKESSNTKGKIYAAFGVADKLLGCGGCGDGHGDVGWFV